MSSVHPIYTLYIGLLLVLHPSLFIQSLSKNYLFSSSRFSGKAFAKVRRFFCNLQIFSKVFLKKFFRRFSEGVRLTLSRSLAHRKVRYSVQHPALSSIASALPVCHLQRLSLSKAVAKVQTFSVSATFTTHFFAIFFQGFI